VEVESTGEVMVVIARTQNNGLAQEVQEYASFGDAPQKTTWVKGPENDTEFYGVLGDAPSMA